MNKEDKTSRSENIESESSSESAEVQSNSALQTDQVVAKPSEELLHKLEDNTTSERDPPECTDSMLESEQANTEEPLQLANAEISANSENCPKADTDSSSSVGQAFTGPLNPEAPLTENIADNSTSEDGPKADTDSILPIHQSKMEPPHEEFLQGGSVEDSATSESGANARSDSLMSGEQASIVTLDRELRQIRNVEHISGNVTDAPTDLAQPIKQPSTSSPAQESAQPENREIKSTGESPTATHASQPPSPQQAATRPLDQEQPCPVIGDTHSQLEKRVSVISIIVAVLTLVAIAVQAWISHQQQKIMSTQVDNTQNNLQLTERAYIGVASLNVDLAEGEIVMMLENLGRKPAKGITVMANAYLVNAIEFKEGGQINFKAGDVRLFPGSFKMRVVVKTPKFDPQQIKDIRKKRQFVFVEGTVFYDNGFGSPDSTEFAFKYIPPEKEGWEAVAISVSRFEEELVSEVYKASMNSRITIDPPSFDSSRKLSAPIYRPLASETTPSPLEHFPSPSANSPSPIVTTPSPFVATPSPFYTPLPSTSSINTPELTRQLDPGSRCACTCRITCENRCEYQCSGCSLIEGVTVASACCEKAKNSVGGTPRCPDYD